MKNNIQYIEKPNYSNEVNIAIENHIDARIQNELIKNGNDEVFHEIRNYKDDKKNELKEFNDYFENNKGNIIEEKNFEEGYNSRTGSIESFDTLLNEYKLNTENNIEEDNFNKLSENAKNELNTLDKLNINQFESSLLLDDYPEVENVLKNIDEDIQKLGQIEQGDLRNVKVSINDFKTSYDVSNINSLNKETIISRDLVNDKQNIKKPTWEYENESQTNNLNQNYKDFENITSKDTTQEIKEDTSTDLQKLKSVEVERNVIGLLPKDQQENTFKEALSRLDNNKTSLKDNLKNYMSNEKIDNAINSVKQHFENIKVKAEDVQQTFKDLGQWNTENKFVKDIDNVINSVKDLGKKHENELLQSDSNSIMSKLNNEYLELKEFVNKAEQDNNTFKEEQNIRSEFVSKMLNAKQIEIDFDPKEVTKDLSENQKLEVYNQLKDLNHHYQNNANTTSLVKEQENKVIIKNLEEDNPEFKNKRQEHVTLKQSLQPIKIETTNEKLDNIIKDSNKDIKKMDGLDKKNFKESKNKEKTITNQNSQSSKIKSNDMFKKMEKLNQQTIKENTEKKEPKISRQSMTR